MGGVIPGSLKTNAKRATKFVFTVCTVMAMSSCESPSHSETQQASTNQTNRQTDAEQPKTHVALKVKNARIAFKDPSELKKSMDGMVNGASISIVNEKGTISVFGEDDGFASYEEIKDMPDEYLNDPRCPIENKSKVDMPDPVLGYILNMNKEFLVGNKVCRMEDMYTYVYSEGHEDEVARFKASGISLNYGDSLKVSEHLSVVRQADISKSPTPSANAKGIKPNVMVFGWGWWRREETINYAHERRMIAVHWHTNLNFLFFQIKSTGAATHAQRWGTKCFIWCWGSWVTDNVNVALVTRGKISHNYFTTEVEKNLMLVGDAVEEYNPGPVIQLLFSSNFLGIKLPVDWWNVSKYLELYGHMGADIRNAIYPGSTLNFSLKNGFTTTHIVYDGNWNKLTEHSMIWAYREFSL